MAERMTRWSPLIGAAVLLVGCATTEPVSDDTASAIAEEVPVMDAEPDLSGFIREMTEASGGALMAESRGLTSHKSPMSRALKSAETSDLSIAPVPPPRSPEEPVQPQSGLLTAGDYDDVLNPDLYKAYLDKVLQNELSGKELPYVDANRRIELLVIDRLGKPMPLTKISVSSEAGEPLFPLRTGVDGKAYLYPLYDALDDGIIVTARVPGVRARSYDLPDELLEEGGEFTIEFASDRKAVTQLDLLLTLDATGSMSDEMAYLQAELVAILDRVRDRESDLDIRAGFVVYRDEGDAYVVRDFAFTGDLESFKAELAKQRAQGGGDFPEAVNQAMDAGLAFDWREDAVKINLLVADAPPHNADIEATWNAGLISRSRGIHVVSLAASGVDKTAEFLMRGMSQITGGRYLFLTDDSGIGLPHAEPTVDCYVVTRLDGLVERVIASLVSGERVEPEGSDVIRTVGDYRKGVCKVEPVEVSEHPTVQAG